MSWAGLGHRSPVCISLVSLLAPAWALSFSGSTCPLGSCAGSPASPWPPDPLLLLPQVLSVSEVWSLSPLPSIRATPFWKCKSSLYLRHGSQTLSVWPCRMTYLQGWSTGMSWSVLLSSSGQCPQAWWAPGVRWVIGVYPLDGGPWSSLSRSTGGRGGMGQMELDPFMK